MACRLSLQNSTLIQWRADSHYTFSPLFSGVDTHYRSSTFSSVETLITDIASLFSGVQTRYRYSNIIQWRADLLYRYSTYIQWRADPRYRYSTFRK